MVVDVILPVYKPNQWVFEAIDSVVNQTYPNWHLLIVDDHSPQPDETIAHIRQITEDNEKISYIRLDQNRKAAAARNVAIAAGAGELIAFLDQDDKWHPEKLERAVNYLISNTDIGLVHSNIECIDREGDSMPGFFNDKNLRRNSVAYTEMKKDVLAKSLFKRNTIRLGTIVVCRKAFEESGGFDESLFGGEDMEFAVRFAAHFGVGHLKKKLSYRRVHTHNVSSVHKKERLLGIFEAVEKIRKELPYLQPLVKERQAVLTKALILMELDEKNRSQALKRSCSLVKLRPLSAIAYVLLAMSFFGISPAVIKNGFAVIRHKLVPHSRREK